MKESLIRKLTDLLGVDRCLAEPEDLICYACDLFARSLPELVVLPKSTEEVSQILALAHHNHTPLTLRGAGTSLTGGPVPVQGGIVMAMTLMNKIIDISPQEQIATVQAGVITGDLQKAAAQHGLFYPPDPTSALYCTIGGNVATNAGGASGVKYGVTRDYVQGLKAVLANGEVLKTGSRCMKSVSGFDFKSAFCGSEGLLCAITEVSVRLLPQPETVTTASAFFPSVGEAARAVAAIRTAGLIPATMELMDGGFLQAVEEVYALAFPKGAGASLLLEFDGVPEIIKRQQQQAEAICHTQNAIEFTLAKNEEERTLLWKARRGGTAALVKNAKFLQTLDYCVPLSRLYDGISGLQDIAEKHHLHMVLIGHAGDGNLHPMFIYDPDITEEKERFHKAEVEMSHFIISLHGTLSGEHGIGIEKEEYLSLELSQAEMELGRKLKAALDPHGILNPGKCGFP